MKKIVCLFMVLLLALSSCGGSNLPQDSESKPKKESESIRDFESETERQKESENDFDLEECTLPCDDLIYVNPKMEYQGSFQGMGNMAYPFAKIEDAISYIEEVVQEGATGHFVIFLQSGEYVLENPITLSSSNFKKAGDDIKITFYGSEKGSIITSNQKFDFEDFTAVGDNLYSMVLPDSSKDKNGEYPVFSNLYLNGKRFPVVTSRNTRKDYCQVDSGRAIASASRELGIDEKNAIIYVDPDYLYLFNTDVDGYFLDEDLLKTTVDFTIKDEWVLQMLKAYRITLSDKVKDSNGRLLAELHIEKDDWERYLTDGNHKNMRGREYWFSASYDLFSCDTEDGFYYNQKTGTIFCKIENIENVENIGYPMTEELFCLEDASHITFQNITFTGGTLRLPAEDGIYVGQAGGINFRGFPTHALIYGNNVKDIVIDSCDFHDVGYEAIYMHGKVEGIVVKNNRFTDVDSCAVRFGENTDLYSTYGPYIKDVLVENNVFMRIGLVYMSSTAIFFSSCCDVTITKNTILSCPYTAISVGYNWSQRDNTSDHVIFLRNVDISYNYIAEFMLELLDGGAIYTLGGNLSIQLDTPINFVHHNVMVLDTSVACLETGQYWTIYHDGSSSHWEDEENLVLRNKDDMRPIVYNIYNFQPLEVAYAYCNHVKSFYLIGLPRKNIDYVIKFSSRFQNVKAVYDEESDSYSFMGEDFTTRHLSFENAFVYESFEDAMKSPEKYDHMQELFWQAGSTLFENESEFGVDFFQGK